MARIHSRNSSAPVNHVCATTARDAPGSTGTARNPSRRELGSVGATRGTKSRDGGAAQRCQFSG
eukprot:274386-Alexandrium_andersonii.AAC.1